MPPGRKKSLTTEDFVTTAIAYADVHGMAALTIRVIGEEVGLTQTAIYRYFHDKDELAGAMKEHFFAEMLTSLGEPTGTPRDRIERIALQFRRLFAQHPCMVSLITALSSPMDNSTAITRRLVDALEQMGFSGRALTDAYQLVESVAIGTCLLDLYGNPHHLTTRLDRFRHVRHPAFDDISRDPSSIEETNEQAYLTAIRLVLDHLERTSAELDRATAHASD